MDKKKWIQSNYSKKENINSLNQQFKTSKPFPHLVLRNFLKEEKATQILEALSKEEFFLKNSDLFTLKQTNDLKGTENKLLKEFREFLKSKEFLQYMQGLTEIKLKPEAIDLNGSLYEDTYHLILHDDQLDTRKVAFVFYFSDFKELDGGSQNLYDHNENNEPTQIVEKIIPQFNTFTFFEVSEISFHEVEEVYSNKSRISIGGWFHEP